MVVILLYPHEFDVALCGITPKNTRDNKYLLKIPKLRIEFAKK